MTKTYNSPMLQIVSIKRNDIVTSSDPTLTLGGVFEGNANQIEAPDRFYRFNSYYEGY